MEKINLAVIFGGRSSEHEVSLSSALGVISALDKEKYNIIPIAITKFGSWLIEEKGQEYIERFKDRAGIEGGIGIEESKAISIVENRNITDYKNNNKIDLVLPILHGPYGEDGRLQGMLDMIGLPYVFSGVLTHALAMNKAKAKIIVKNSGVLVAEDMVIGEKYEAEEILKKISLPVVIKPTELGSSVGISIARDKKSLKEGIEDALKYNKEVIIEKYIKGREFTVTVMGNENPEVLAITEIIPKISEFYDYKAKYEIGGSEHICPAQLPDDVAGKMKESAIKAFKALGCNDLSRADFILSESGEPYFIEINTIPGMTPTSLAPEAAKAAGMDFTQFLDRLIEGAFNRYKK